MCNQDTSDDIKRYEAQGGQLNRRDFSKLLAMGCLATAFPGFADNHQAIESKEVTITTPDGTADCLFVYPTDVKGPAVLLWPDIKGRREAFDEMGKRLAKQGYAVLVVNPFYRDIKGSPLPKEVKFPSEEAWAILRPLRGSLTDDAVVSDAQTFFAWLDQQAAVDTSKGAAAMGYCMSGTFTMRAAAAMPERVKAIASFHGGGLASDRPNSPHLLIPKMKAAALHAIAANDHSRRPEMFSTLKDAYGEVDIPSEIEIYTNTLHGWTVPDSRAYNDEQAERAWARMLVLFEKNL